MSNLVNANGYNDPEIVAIRNQVNTNTDTIPYLLLPVKIETRFMRVDRPILTPDVYADVLEGLFEIEDRMRFTPAVLPPHEVLGKIKKVQNLLDDVNSKIKEIKRLSTSERENIQNRFVQIQKTERKLSQSLSKVRWTDRAKLRDLRVQKNLLSTKMQLTAGTIKELQVTKENNFSESDAFLNNLESINDTLHNISRKDVASSDRKEKKTIFSSVDTQFENVTNAVRKVKQEININLHATPQQVKRLDTLKDELDSLFKAVKTNLNKVKSDYKKAEYFNKIENLKKNIDLINKEIDSRVKPKIEMRQNLNTINAREVVLQVNDLRYKLKQLNRNAFKSYAEVKSTRTLLYKKLHSLRANAHKIVEGTDEELQAISRAWDDIDSELEKFTQRVKNYKGVGREKAGLARTATHINKEYRKDLEGLKSDSKSFFTNLGNITLEKSAVNYTKSLTKLGEIQKEIEENVKAPTSKRFTTALKNLIEFQKSFAALSKDIHILPEKSLDQLKNLSTKIESDLDSIISTPSRLTRTNKALIRSATASSKNIKSVIDEQYTDAIDRKDKFYDLERNPFVFAKKTITRDELWVRIYPDDIAIHTHEEPLTEDELEAGKAYWTEIWAANDDYETKLAAWRAISTAYGSQRAAWIVKLLEPIEIDRSTILKRFRSKSKNTLQINSYLKRISKVLAEAGDSISKQIGVLGEVYTLLIQIEKHIQKISEDHINLLLTTQKLLLKVQSQINNIIRNLQKVPVSERKELAEQLEMAQQVISVFNRIAKYFQGIKRLNSKEIIGREPALQKVFPKVKTKDASWTVAPHSKVMPNRFVVVAMDRKGNYKYIVPTKPIADELIVGLDPATFENAESFSYDADGNLIVDDSIKWLTDFNEAVNKGMAVYIILDENYLTEGFEKIFVIGVKDTSAPVSKTLIEKLIDNHHYIPEGASFLPVSTPTNNTEAGESGYRTFEEDAALSFAIERNNEETVVTTSDSDYPTDAERLSKGLGIDTDVLDNLDYHDRKEVSEALNMNKALFHGTLGNYLEEGLDTLFTLDNINHTKAFMTNYVTARGYLPSIRVGTQPYGILPTTAFSKFHATANDSFIPSLNIEDFETPSDIKDELQTRYNIRLKILLNGLNSLWTEIRNNNVPYTGNTNPDDPQAHFMQMLGLQANSTEHFFRYGLNVASRQALEEVADFSVNFNPDDPFGPTMVANTFRNYMLTGYYYKSDRFEDEYNEELSLLDRINKRFSRISDQFSKARVFTTRHLKDQSQILGDIIDNRELADEVVATSQITGESTAEEIYEANAELQNFINWLLNNDAWEVHAENKFSIVDGDTVKTGMPSKSMLFLFLRHSLLSAHADTMLKILEFEGLIDQETRKKMGMPGYYYNYYADGFNYVTKWTYLYSKIYDVRHLLGFSMDVSNPFYFHMNNKKAYLNQYISPENSSTYHSYSNRNQHQTFIEELNQTRDAIRKLKDIPTSRLEQLLVEHVDLCTYRLDSWRLGMVNKRLSEQREGNPDGLFIGAYGWVEDLNKGGDRVVAENIPAGLWKNGDNPVYTDEDNLGFIHTPSLNHAITAAILRAGYQANSDTAEVENQMAINLSSARVRMGLNLLNGIRNGQDAAAILGYQFERGLHERYLHIPLELDQYIYDFREEFPLSVPVDGNVSLGEAQLTNVVNGIELLETAQEFIDDQGGPPNLGDSIYQSLKAYENAWWTHVKNSNISAATPAKKDAMLKEIDRMADAFDALGDICISESVYQVAQGNHVRASAIMDKLAKGDVPSEIQITDTPRTGTVVTHKVAQFFEAITTLDYDLTETGETSIPISGAALDSAIVSNNARATGWNSAFTPRAIAEPTLNKWAGEMIGDPSKIKCHVTYKAGEITGTATVLMSDLEVQPLDILHLMGTGPIDGGAELNARIANFVKGAIALPVDFEGNVDDTEITIKYTLHDESWADDEYSFYEKAGFIQSLRKTITDSAPLAADTLLIPGEEELEENEVKNQLVDEYLIRVTNLSARLERVQSDLQAFFTDEIAYTDVEGHTFTEGQVNSLRALLAQCSVFGIPGTIPDQLVSFDNETGKTLLASADGASKAIAKRMKQAGRFLALAKDTTKLSNPRVGAIRDAAKTLLGKAFIMLPHFTLRRASEITDQLNLDVNKGLLREAPDYAIESWIHGLARVRERIGITDTVDMWAENFDRPLPEKQVIQFPFAQDASGNSADYWLGLEFPDGYVPSEDKLSVVITNAQQINNSSETPKAAILVDEWVEIIPNVNETSGITFNYDQPDAKAPNTILLAVTPQEKGTWNWDDLVYTLNDTLELAKNRAVEPEQLENTVFGQILPGIMNEIIPPQLLPKDAEDSGDAQNNPMGRQVITDFRVVNDTYETEDE